MQTRNFTSADSLQKEQRLEKKARNKPDSCTCREQQKRLRQGWTNFLAHQFCPQTDAYSVINKSQREGTSSALFLLLLLARNLVHDVFIQLFPRVFRLVAALHVDQVSSELSFHGACGRWHTKPQMLQISTVCHKTAATQP